MEKYDIIILAGQSNAEGQGLGETAVEYTPDERVHFMKDLKKRFQQGFLRVAAGLCSSQKERNTLTKKKCKFNKASTVRAFRACEEDGNVR